MDVEIDMKAVFAVMKIRPEKKNKSLKPSTGFWTQYFCDTCAVLFSLS